MPREAVGVFVVALLLLATAAYADRMKWSADLNRDITGGLIIDGGYIYVTALDMLYKIDILDGRTIWTLQLKGTLLKPVKMESIIIVPSKEGSIYLVNDGTKSIIKTLNVSGEILNSPLLIPPNAYFPTSKGIVALNAQSNAISWKQSQECPVQATPISIGDAVVALCDNGNVMYVARSNGAVTDQAKYDDVFWKPSPAVQDTRVIIGSFGGKIYALSTKSPKNIVWVRPTQDGTSVAADIYADSDEIIVTTAGGKICSLNVDGSQKWCKSTSSEVASKPIVTESWIYAITDSGTMYGISHDGDVSWAYESGLLTKADIAKKGSMIYAVSKNGTVAALSTSSCSIIFPEDGSDVAGVEQVEVTVDPYADMEITSVQVRSENGAWVDAAKTKGVYIAKIPITSIPSGSSSISCRVVSKDGEELPPYTSISIKKEGAGKRMRVEAPTNVGFGSSFSVKILNEKGEPLDKVTVIFGSLQYTDVSGSIKIAPPAKGTYRLEVRRAGYVPFRQDVTVSDDYTIMLVVGGLFVLAVAVFYILYKRWMEE
ncbi:MAG: PQQ-binding-like beta-propeller repeat protein [Candidatus Micrarchaeota archaeon]|nr:PQQ-binding-like beta-propeller repeat protein [Candidatus Micrarchaeota archaeon]